MHQELVSDVNLYADAAAKCKDPFIFSKQTPPPPSLSQHSASKPSRNRDRNLSVSNPKLVTRKDKGILSFMRDFLNSNKRQEIDRPYDPVQITHVGFNSSTDEFTGLFKESQKSLQDSEIIKSDQEKDLLAFMEIVKLYNQGGGDVWDKVGHAPAPGSSRSPRMVPGAGHAAYPGRSKSVDDSFVPTVCVFLPLFPTTTF